MSNQGQNHSSLDWPVYSVFNLLFILFYLHNVSMSWDESPESGSLELVSDSEWKILQYYMEKSEEAITGKDREIQLYRKKVADYDEQLTVLRQLIVSKREIETYLLESEQRLKARGYNQDQINEELKRIEEEQVSGLAPEMIKQYNLNLNEINQEIDRVLNEKI